MTGIEQGPMPTVATATSVAHWLANALNVSRLDLVLELGCGAAELGDLIAPRCYHWFGAEANVDAVRQAARRLRAHANATIVETPAWNLGCFYRETFDIVYCVNATVGCDDWWQGARRLLRPGGRFAILGRPPVDFAETAGWNIQAPAELGDQRLVVRCKA